MLGRGDRGAVQALVSEYIGPFAEWQVRGHHQADPLVAEAGKPEQILRRVPAQGHVCALSGLRRIAHVLWRRLSRPQERTVMDFGGMLLVDRPGVQTKLPAPVPVAPRPNRGFRLNF